MIRNPAYDRHWAILERVYSVHFTEEDNVKAEFERIREGGVHPWGVHYRISPFGSHEAGALLKHMKDVQEGIDDKQEALRAAWDAMLSSGIVALAPILYLSSVITFEGPGFAVSNIELPPSMGGVPSGEPLSVSGDMLLATAVQLCIYVGGPFVGTGEGLGVLGKAILNLADLMAANGIPGLVLSKNNLKTCIGLISAATGTAPEKLVIDTTPSARGLCNLARIAGGMDVELHFRMGKTATAFNLAKILLDSAYCVPAVHLVLASIDDETWEKFGQSLRIAGRQYRRRDARVCIDTAGGFAATEKLAKAYRDSNTVMTSTMRNQFPILGVMYDRPDVTIEQVHLHHSASAMRLKAPSTDATAPYGCLAAAAVCLGTTLLLKALPALVKDL